MLFSKAPQPTNIVVPSPLYVLVRVGPTRSITPDLSPVEQMYLLNEDDDSPILLILKMYWLHLTFPVLRFSFK